MRGSSRQAQLWLFVCTLCIYGARAFFSSSELIWDESRYLGGAARLIGGEFVSPENPDIVNGPGYPFLLALLMSLGLPVEAIRAANAVLMAFGVWFMYRATLPYAGTRWALGVATVLAFHPILIYFVPFIMSEGLTIFCVAGFAWAITTLLRRERITVPLLCICVLVLTWLVLTRVLFGYVITIAVIGVALMAGLRRDVPRAWTRSLIVLTLSFGLCVPYLAYTYQLTGQVFKWSTNGGELLYWATSTNPGELGSWFSTSRAMEESELAPNHAEFLAGIDALPVLEREAAFRTRAMESIRANPVGVLQNWVDNINRLIFNFPRSYHDEELRTTVLILFQCPILALGGLAIFCMAKWPREIQPEIWLLSILTFIYLGLSSVLPAMTRYFIVVFPWIGLVMAATLGPRLRIQLDRVPQTRCDDPFAD